MNDFEKMACLLLTDCDKTPEYYENIYPPRNMPEGARVTRIAPSPTGYLHLGVLFSALINRIAADYSGGLFYTRIEDTDKKREVAGGVEDIISGLERFGIKIDEGFVAPDEIKGNYGPYRQSERVEIYHAFAKVLIEQGLAYPCFCTEEELAEIRNEQERQKVRTGCYGQWAKYRDITYEQAKELIDNGRRFVVRLKSPGSEETRVFFDDCIKGKIEMPENDEDFVLLKSDGVPTYHFAHAIDDHLMRTTHVIRGDEWISSTPKHLQLFKLLGFKPPKYAHVAPLLKSDNGAKRKISKRKDPEAAVKYFAERGFELEAVTEYLMTVMASDFEDWRRRNSDADRGEYKFSFKKLSVSGALFDENKLIDVSKNIVSRMNSQQVCDRLIKWAKEFDEDFCRILTEDINYTRAVFSIDRDTPKPRKDIAKWDEAKAYCAYFYDTLFEPGEGLPENIAPADAAAVLRAYAGLYDPSDDKQQWFDRIKGICPALGFAAETAQYKADPTGYKGSAGDVSTVIRLAVTGRRNTPDLCSVMKLLGKQRCKDRMLAAADSYENFAEVR